MNLSKIRHLSLFVFLVLTLASCQLDKILDLANIDGVTYNGEYAIPLFHSKINLDDLLTDQDSLSFLEIEDDGFMTVHYAGDVYSVDAEDLIQNLSVPLPVIFTDSTFLEDSPLGSSFDLDFADLNAGDISFQVISDIEEDIELDIVLENLTQNGMSYVRHLSIPYNGTTPTEIVISDESLDGYRLNLSDKKIRAKYFATKSNGERVLLPTVFVLVQNMRFSYVEGYFGVDVYDIAIDTITIGLLENSLNGNVQFEDPKLTMTVNNSMGVPMNAKFNEVAVVTKDGTKIDLQSSFITDGIQVAYPKLSEVGQVSETVFHFDNTNSNLIEILNGGPEKVIYDIDGIPNPGQDASIRGFFTDSSYVNINVELELPLYGSASGFLVLDSFDVDFGDIPAELDGVEFKLVTDNELPLDLGIQLFFLDEADVVIDSLFTGDAKVISAATVDSDGVVMKDAQGKPIPQEAVTFINIDTNTFDKISKASKIVTRAAFSTFQNVAVKIFSSHDVNLRMGVKFNVKN